MELALLGDIYVGFHLAVNQLITDKTQYNFYLIACLRLVLIIYWHYLYI